MCVLVDLIHVSLYYQQMRWKTLGRALEVMEGGIWSIWIIVSVLGAVVGGGAMVGSPVVWGIVSAVNAMVGSPVVKGIVRAVEAMFGGATVVGAVVGGVEGPGVGGAMVRAAVGIVMVRAGMVGGIGGAIVGGVSAVVGVVVGAVGRGCINTE